MEIVQQEQLLQLSDLYEIEMEMVQQEQRLQLKMKFLLGYNMKIVVLWMTKILWENFSWWRKTIQGLCGWLNFSEVNFFN